jgi:hypothetical protein
MVDYTTALMAELQRAVDRVIDSIAKDGLVALKSALDSAGFGEYDSLKNYEVYAHVNNGEIRFEIIVDLESLDEETKQRLRPRDEDEHIRKATKMFAFSGIGGMTRRVTGSARRLNKPAHDARTKIHDARKPARSGARDATKGAEERLAGHELALRAPRGMSITNQGKLSIVLEKSIQETTRDVRFPQGDFQGVIGDFMDKLNKVVVEKFAPELEDIVSRRFR